MAKRALWWALGVTLFVFVALPFAVGLWNTDENALRPPTGELVIMGLNVVIVFALTFTVAHAVERLRGRRSAHAQMRANR